VTTLVVDVVLVASGGFVVGGKAVEVVLVARFVIVEVLEVVVVMLVDDSVSVVVMVGRQDAQTVNPALAESPMLPVTVTV